MHKANKINALVQLVAFLLMLAINAAANILPLNGLTTGEISAMYPNFFVPAGYTFSIWLVLYLLQSWWILFSLRIAFQKKDDLPAAGLIALLMPYFSLACMLNAFWIMAWHFLQISLSLIVMVLLLLVLITIYIQLRALTVPPEGWISWFIPVVFVSYLAWICVATIANVAALLIKIKADHWFDNGPLWSVLMMAVALLLSVWIGGKRREPVFAFVLCWALLGIYHGQYGKSAMVAYFAMGASVVSGVIGVYSGFNKMKESAINGVL